MKDKLVTIILSLCTLSLFTSCSNDSFKVEGFLSDTGEQSFKIIYVNEAGVQLFRVPVEKGIFEIEGVSPNLTMLLIYNNTNDLIAKAVVKNGDKLSLRGTMKHHNLIEVTGNDINENWSKFRRDNHLLYEPDKENILNQSIENFIKENPDNNICLPLLLYDYTNLDDTKQVYDLLNLINEENRVASIMKAYTDMNAMLSLKKDNQERFTTISFYNEKDSLESFQPVSSKMSILYFWDIEDDNREDIINELDSIYVNYKGKKQLQIADIILDNDTAKWKRTLRQENTDWNHYWAVGGEMNNMLMNINIHSTPYFMVLDSIGQPIYKGDSIEVVYRFVKTKFKRTTSKPDKKNYKKK